MKTLRLNEKCPKCGGGNLHYRYFEEKVEDGNVIPEHISLKCCRCEYKWRRKTLSQAESVEILPVPVVTFMSPGPRCTCFEYQDCTAAWCPIHGSR